MKIPLVGRLWWGVGVSASFRQCSAWLLPCKVYFSSKIHGNLISVFGCWRVCAVASQSDNLTGCHVDLKLPSWQYCVQDTAQGTLRSSACRIICQMCPSWCLAPAGHSNYKFSVNRTKSEVLTCTCTCTMMDFLSNAACNVHIFPVLV